MAKERSVNDIKNEIKALQKELRELRGKTIVAGKAMYGYQHYAGPHEDEWYIGVYLKPSEYDRKMNKADERLVRIVKSNTKDDILERLDVVIDSLTRLRNKLEVEFGEEN